MLWPDGGRTPARRFGYNKEVFSAQAGHRPAAGSSLQLPGGSLEQSQLLGGLENIPRATPGSGLGQDIGCSQQTPSRPAERFASSSQASRTPFHGRSIRLAASPRRARRRWPPGSGTRRARGRSDGETILGNVRAAEEATQGSPHLTPPSVDARLAPALEPSCAANLGKGGCWRGSRGNKHDQASGSGTMSKGGAAWSRPGREAGLGALSIPAATAGVVARVSVSAATAGAPRGS